MPRWPDPRTPARRAVRLVALVLLALVAAACRTTVTVAVDVDPDGAGTVTVTVVLDREAAAQLGDPKGVALDDLRTAGWRVEDPVATGDGGVRFRVARPFASPDQLADVLAEVGGADGVFRGTRLAVDDGTASTSYSFRSGVHLTGDPAQFGDEDLTKVLGGLPLGRTPQELQVMGAAAPGAGTLVVSVDLPGGSPDSNGTVRDGRAGWRYPLTGGSPTDAVIRSSAEDADAGTVALLAGGAALLVAAVVVAVVGLVRTRRGRTEAA